MVGSNVMNVNNVDFNLSPNITRKKNKSIFLKANILKMFSSSSPPSKRLLNELENVNQLT